MANAGKLYADLSKLGNGPVSTWDGTTNTMTWTGKSNNMISNLDFAAGDYKTYTTVTVSSSDYSNGDYVRLQIRANGQEKTQSFAPGTVTKSLIDDYGFTTADLASFEWARLLGSSWDDSHTIETDNPASAKINSVYLEEPSKTLDVDLTAMAASEGNATWDNSTGKFAWTGTWSNAITLPGLSGNLSAYTTVNYETAAGTCDHFRILLYYSNGAGQTTYQAICGTKSITFAEMGVATENLAFVSSIKISGASDATGDIILKSFQLEGPLVSYIEASYVYEAPAGTTDVKNLTGTESGWAASVSYPKEFAVQGAAFGNGNGDAESTHVDINGYDYICFEVTSANNSAGLRVWIWDDVNNTVVTLYAKPIADYANENTKYTEASKITSPGTYVAKVSGYKYLKGVKAANDWGSSASIVSMAYMCKGEAPTAYAPTGKYTLVGGTEFSTSLTSALADANATFFDATGVTGTGVDLTSVANPNALFKAAAGTLANTNNVIVDGVCANLVLTDNHPFKAPADFTATAASYTTTINATAQAGTLCLPFAAAIPEGVTAYTMSYTSGDAATVTPVDGTIPANTPVLLNGSGEKTFSGSSVAIDADASNVNGALTGVFAATIVPLDSYVLQNGTSGVGFYKVATSDITAKPFRAYLTAEGAGAKEFLSFDFQETGIETIAEFNGSKVQGSEIYNLAGQRLSKLQKGVNIVNGKKVLVQ